MVIVCALDSDGTIYIYIPRTSWSWFSHDPAQRRGFTRIHAYIMIKGITHHFMVLAATPKLSDVLKDITFS